jgi:hypothetical protein
VVSLGGVAKTGASQVPAKHELRYRHPLLIILEFVQYAKILNF